MGESSSRCRPAEEHTLGTMAEDIDHLDILGEQPALFKLYTQICSVYTMGDDSATAREHVCTILRNGLNSVAQSFPWLAGIIVNEGASMGVTGRSRIVRTDTIPLVVKDLRRREGAPTLDAMRKAGFPLAMLDEHLVAPCMTLNLPGTSTGLVSDEGGPVFAVQATFIAGGLLLTVVGQHNAMDMMGQANVMRLLCKACSGEDFSDEELDIGNADKSRCVKLLDDSWQPGNELDRQLVKPAVRSSLPPAHSTWAYVTFSPESQRLLKVEATSTMPPTSAFVSTDDAICAFIWKCVSRARLSYLDGDTDSTFARAIDARKYVKVPGTYPGALMNMVYNSNTLAALASAPLGEIAAQLRGKLQDEAGIAHNTRALATYLGRCADKSVVSITACVDAHSGVLLSSWAKVGTILYELEFGLGLGQPLVVRRPRFAAMESLMYIMPKAPGEAELAVAMCVSDADWRRLHEDECWRRHIVHVG
ncbi:acetyltransferase [Limtongia smithiae]|uniref:acetyltransferase n=1 Tax=Limtongia smithiae TaxID=1125753 RepID=UPI0034D019F2